MNAVAPPQTPPQTPPPSRALRLASLHFSLLPRTVEAMALGMVISDATRPETPIVYCNPGFERLTGYSAAEVVGRNCRFLQGPDTDRGELARLRAAVADGRSCSVVLKNYRKDGTAFWNALTVTPLTDDDGRVTHYVGVQTDITAVKELEAQFLHAQKMELIGRLTGAVAHDFNNLLTVIGGFTEAAQDVLGADHPSAALLNEVAAAGRRGAGLTRQLLAFSRKGGGRHAGAKLNVSVSGCEGMLRRLVGPNTRLTVRFDPRAGTVGLDVGRLEQVLMNLAVNARDAMPGGGALTVETIVADAADVPELSAGSYAVVRVADTGHGMDAATLARVFEPFFTTKPAGRGTGLGLSTVLDIVRGAGGCVRVASEPGRGTEFRVYLPQVTAAPTDPQPDCSGEYRMRGSEVVLVVDEDAAVRAVMGLTLRARGYTVLEAGGADEAVAVARQHPGPLQLVVVDAPPGASPAVLVERFRAARPGIRVLLVSGTADEAGAAFLPKPFAPIDLAAKVRAVLDRP